MHKTRCLLDDKEMTLRWSSAGHEPAFWLHSGSTKIEELPNTGYPLGIIEKEKYEQGGPVKLKKDDILVVGTDGIWEAQNDKGKFFGKKRFLEIIRESSELTAEDICSSVIENVTQFIQPASFTDDITLIVIKVK